MIPTEDNYVDWTLDGIREYFRRLDYRVRTYSIGQVKERECPVDRILAVGNKIVGLQHKRPASEKHPWRYKTTAHQHADIAKARWIFYCLPDFADFRLQEVALYHCRFAPAEGVANINATEQYYRWGAFATGLIECWIGLEMRNSETVERVIGDMLDNPQDTYLVLNRLAEEVYLLRPGEAQTALEREPA
jgi:hypothetical protein